MEKMEQLKKIFAQDQELAKKFAQKAKECTDKEQVIDVLAEVLEEKGAEISRDDIVEMEEQLGELSEEQLEAVAGGDPEEGLIIMGMYTILGFVLSCVVGVGEIVAVFMD